MGTDRLSKDTWLAAGFRALAEEGPKAVQIKALAARLGATKGSFYWHFTDLAAFKAAMLAVWRDRAFGDIAAEADAQTTPQARLQTLFTRAAGSAPEEFGGQAIETAMRAWALSDGDVAKALAGLDASRLQVLRQTLHDLGHPDPALADLVYAAYLGLDDLRARGREVDFAAAMGALQAVILKSG